MRINAWGWFGVGMLVATGVVLVGHDSLTTTQRVEFVGESLQSLAIGAGFGWLWSQHRALKVISKDMREGTATLKDINRRMAMREGPQGPLQ